MRAGIEYVIKSSRAFMMCQFRRLSFTACCASLIILSQDNPADSFLITTGQEYGQYLENIGYKPNVYSKNIGEKTYFDYNSGTNNYVDTYLFTSDEVIGTRGNLRNEIKIKFIEQDGVIVNTVVWIDKTDLKSDIN